LAFQKCFIFGPYFLLTRKEEYMHVNEAQLPHRMLSGACKRSNIPFFQGKRGYKAGRGAFRANRPAYNRMIERDAAAAAAANRSTSAADHKLSKEGGPKQWRPHIAPYACLEAGE
jgi:hypothetical protein